MAVTVDNEQKLADAIKNGEDTIEIEGDLKEKVVRIKATGKVAWAVAIGAIGIAVCLILLAPPTGGTTAGFVGIAAPAAVAILGGPATLSCIAIAIAAGGVGVLNKLRSYKLVEENGIVMLKK